MYPVLAQLVEHLTVVVIKYQIVIGSIPISRTPLNSSKT